MDDDIHMAKGKPAFAAYMKEQGFTEDSDPKLVMRAWAKCARPQYLDSLELVVVHGMTWAEVLSSKLSWEDTTANIIEYRRVMDEMANASRTALNAGQNPVVAANAAAQAGAAPRQPPTPPNNRAQQPQAPQVLNLAEGHR